MIVNKKRKCKIVWGADLETKLIVSALPVDTLTWWGQVAFQGDICILYAMPATAFTLSKIISLELDLLA